MDKQLFYMGQREGFVIGYLLNDVYNKQDFKVDFIDLSIIFLLYSIMGHRIFFGQRNGKQSLVDFFNVAYQHTINSINIYIDKKVKMAEVKIIWIIFYIIGIPLYIFATATNFDTWKAVLLFIIAACFGLLNVGRVAIKFFKELLIVIIDYKKEKIQIESAVQLYIIIALVVVIIILIAIILFLVFK